MKRCCANDVLISTTIQTFGIRSTIYESCQPLVQILVRQSLSVQDDHGADPSKQVSIDARAGQGLSPNTSRQTLNSMFNVKSRCQGSPVCRCASSLTPGPVSPACSASWTTFFLLPWRAGSPPKTPPMDSLAGGSVDGREI